MPLPPRTDEGRVLVVTGSADASRKDALGRLAATCGPRPLLVQVPNGAASPVQGADDGPSLSAEGFAGVLLDGVDLAGLPAGFRTGLRAALAAGTSLLVLASGDTERPVLPEATFPELAGLAFGRRSRLAEWIATPLDPASGLTTRIAPRLVVYDRVAPVRPGPARVLVTVRVGLRDEPAVAEACFGQGRVVACGLGATEVALRDEELGRLLARALRPESASARPVGAAVLGYGPLGGTGRAHALALSEVPGFELVAVADSAPERRKAAEEEFPGVRVHEGADALVSDPDVDLVVVATPPASHAAHVLAALRAGKHVLCEKPLCLGLAEADELFAEAARQGLMLTVHQNRRFDQDFLAVRRAVEEGRLGELFSAETFVGGFEHPCGAWHSDASVSGGAVYDWGAHHLDWIVLLMGGFPEHVVAHGHKRVWHDVTNLDQVRVRMTWDDGREAEFVHSDVAAVRRPKFYLQGTEGTLVGHYRPLRLERVEPGLGYVLEQPHHAEAPADLVLARYEPGLGVSETRLPLPPRRPFPLHRNVADHLLFGEPLEVRPEAARGLVGLLEAAHRSSLEGGRPFAVPKP